MDSPYGVSRFIVEPSADSPDSEAVAVMTAQGREPALLETLQPTWRAGRFSIYACDPVETMTVTNASALSPIVFLRKLAACTKCPEGTQWKPDVIPFVGGWIGYLSYEAGLVGKRVLPRPSDSETVPLLRFGLYDHLLVFDHLLGQWFVCAVEWAMGGPDGRPSADHRLDLLRKRLRAAAGLTPPQLTLLRSSLPVSNFPPDAYRRKVRRAIEYIEAGDVYQVNLSRRFSFQTNADPLNVYRRLRQTNPSSHAAFLRWDDSAVLCSSPELFLDVDDGIVVTRPIKGTRPRTEDPTKDAARRIELQESEKDRAELTMIVDLLRNDLGRVCEFGSVRVTEAGEIEEHPTVFHRVATVEGRLRQNCSWVDLLEASFPGGSITGAPKLRAMQIIRELEPTPRELYCGSIGWIGLDGRCSFNIAIRTMLQRGNLVHAYAGGAIVAESDPSVELDEIRAKSEGMLAALGVGEPVRVARRSRTGVVVA